MQSDNAESDAIDWSLTTWDGARLEQIRRCSRMPLAEMILALEEMQVLAEKAFPVFALRWGGSPLARRR